MGTGGAAATAAANSLWTVFGPSPRGLRLRGNRGLDRLEPDLGVLPVAERLGGRSPAPAQEHPRLALQVIEIAVPVAQLELAEVTGDEVGTVLSRDYFQGHLEPPDISKPVNAWRTLLSPAVRFQPY